MKVKTFLSLTAVFFVTFILIIVASHTIINSTGGCELSVFSDKNHHDLSQDIRDVCGHSRGSKGNDTNNASAPDTDNDGLSDNEDPDDDNDGLPDVWENKWRTYAIEHGYVHFFDPKNGSDASLDWDDDGYSNINEYIAGTNPYDNQDYPYFEKDQYTPSYNWLEFILVLGVLIFIVMTVTIIIGIHIIRKRKQEDMFYSTTFDQHTYPSKSGSGKGLNGADSILRDKYLEWSSKVESEQPPVNQSKYKYKLEIIGGPDDDHDDVYNTSKGLQITRASITHRNKPKQKTTTKLDPKFIGRTCLWCDKAITHKYIKSCTGMRTFKKRCTDGPFCSKRCLNEHLELVPHYREVNF